jgi:hypothetical protein
MRVFSPWKQADSYNIPVHSSVQRGAPADQYAPGDGVAAAADLHTRLPRPPPAHVDDALRRIGIRDTLCCARVRVWIR